MQVVEWFDTAVVGGVPVNALIEDDHGVRWLSSDFPLAERTWAYCLEYVIAGVRTLSGEHVLNAEVASLPRRDGNILREVLVVPSRNDQRFVHLHLHTEYSPLDGLTTVEEAVGAVIRDGQDAIAVTDHGVCAAHLELQMVCQAHGIKPIFGLEAYLVDDHRARGADVLKEYWHFILWATTRRGLDNLWALSTQAYIKGFYGRPRMDWEMMAAHSEGLAASTACLRGPLADDIINEREDAVTHKVGKLQAIFGDRLFVELHTNGLPQQVKVNRGLLQVARDHSLPIIAVADSHYACAGDHDTHKLWLAMQTNKSIQDEGDLFAGDEYYHISGAREVATSLSYLGPDIVAGAIANTGYVADLCDVTIEPRKGTPTYHRHEQPHSEAQGADLDRQRMIEICQEAWDAKLGHIDEGERQVYVERFDHEVAELSGKGFCGYMLIVWDYCDWAHRERILIGPGRGSAAGSLVCYLLGITGIDPVEADLKFERFISPGRTELPDIDVDFPSSKRDQITSYIIKRWGDEHVVRVGTVTRLKNAGVFKSVAQAFKGTPDEVEYTDSEAISKIIDEIEIGSAGFGVTYEDLMAVQREPLQPYRDKYPKLFHYAERVVGRLKSYGRHPAGIVIDPEHSLTDRLPMRIAKEEGQVVAEFPMDILGWMNYVKFDILTLRTLDTLQAVMDLVAADPLMEGFVFDPQVWRKEYEDPQVWEALCSGDTTGVFQLESPLGTKLARELQPQVLADLCAHGTLNRPGPRRSGAQGAFLRRRAGLEQVSYDHPLLEQVLGGTHGLMIYQEDVMNVCIALGGYTSAEADEVRSILGKKKIDKIPKEGQRFLGRCIANGIPEHVANSIWEKMAEFAAYAFNKSHSWAYGMLGYWCAWAKVHLPSYFLVAALSTVDKERIPDFINLVRSLDYRVYPPDVNESVEGFSVSSDRLGVRYGIASVKGLGGSKAAMILSERNKKPFDSILALANSKVDFGSIKILAQVGALDSLIPEGHNRNDLEVLVDFMSTEGAERCHWLDPGADVQGLPCGFDWATGDVVIGKSGKPLKARPLPKKCNRACRHYTAESVVEWPTLPPPSAKQIRLIERELLGVYVSHSPFDAINIERARENGLASLAEFETGPYDECYKMVGEIASVRTRKDKTGKWMGFLTITLRDGTINTVVFHDSWDNDRSMLKADAFGIFVLVKGRRGPVYRNFYPIVVQEEAHGALAS